MNDKIYTIEIPFEEKCYYGTFRYINKLLYYVLCIDMDLVYYAFMQFWLLWNFMLMMKLQLSLYNYYYYTLYNYATNVAP